jgi:hypothetical protein
MAIDRCSYRSLAADPGSAAAVLPREVGMDATYYTVSDEQYFLGSVMLFNSLQVTANLGEVVVLDVGLLPHQRDLLERYMNVVSVRDPSGKHRMMKPYPYLLQPSGTVVAIDSDIIVTGSLASTIELARDGKICACPAWTSQVRTRWFPEWESTLSLELPLRREDWFHTGFVAFATEHWPKLLERWWNVSDLTSPDDLCVSGPRFKGGDADALNALLMSEIPREALILLPGGEEAFGGSVTIEDVHTLRCTSRGQATRLLHYPDRPKPWVASGWLRFGASEYARVMRRLLLSDDLPIQVDPRYLPLWLRSTVRGRFTRHVLGAVNQVVVAPAKRAPDPLGEWLRRLRRRFT